MDWKKFWQEYKIGVIVLALVLAGFMLSKAVGRGTGVENCDINYLKDFCAPGKSLWQTSNPSCPGGIMYVLSTSQPPTYTLKEACVDGMICCNNNGAYQKQLASTCSIIVTGDLCAPHECEKDSDCGQVLLDAPNDCTVFWKPVKELVQGECLSYECEYLENEGEVCTSTQKFLQDYKYYIIGGLTIIIIALLLSPPRRRK